ncbi:MAG: LysM peptidoglycan-binding domain-containing protein [Bacillota bacterium]|jgi:peptidoglycan endopeptidase LytF
METRQQVPPCPNGTIYTIRSGDTFFSLASRFNTSVDAIVAANPNVDPNNLQVGQQICIPVPPTPGPCPGGTIYTIRAGDTLFALANRFNTTVNAILEANPGLDPDNLQVGRRICIPVPPTPGPCPGGTIYTIRAGDTLFALANRFNTTVNAIVEANPNIDPNRLQVGQQICIPVPPTPECPGGTIYTIRAGDTLFALANRFNTTVNAILRANPGLDPNRLEVGQRICIPVPPAPECPGRTYTIRAGDTFFSIARRFGFTVQQLLDANPDVDPDQLQVGQVICLPPSPNGPVPCPGGRIYVIRAGDTLVGIANRAGITLRQLLAANPQITDPDVIFIGQSICIPGNMRGDIGENYADSPYQGQMFCPFAPFCSMFFRPF